MSFAKFKKLYSELQSIPSDTKSIENKFNKPDIANYLSVALKALKCADDILILEVDKMLNTAKSIVDEAQNQQNSNRHPVSESRQTVASNSVNKPPAIVLKPMDSKNIPESEIKYNINDALTNVRVDNTHMAKSGTILIHVPTLEERDTAVKRIESALTKSHVINKPKQITPRLLIKDVFDEYPDNSLIDLTCEKDQFLADRHKSGTLFKVERSWKPGYKSERPFRNVIIQCSKEIRNHIINKNGGNLYFGLSRCAVQDYVAPKRCFHCHRFNHVAESCMDKKKPRVCGLCADNHETATCPGASGSYRKCVNCVRKNEEDPYHSAGSASCPIFLKIRRNILEKMCFDFV